MSKKIFRSCVFSFFVVALTTMSAMMFPRSTYAACARLPHAPQMNAMTAGDGEIKISWGSMGGASSYAVVYGTSMDTYQYGGDPIGGKDTTWNTIRSLSPGKTYYFRMIAKDGSCSSPWSSEVSAVAGGAVAQTIPLQMAVGTTMSQTISRGPMKGGPVGNMMFWGKSGPGTGQVTLYWKDADSADNYHLMYGTSGGSYQYGALNIGNIRSFTVRQLAPGKQYMFSLVPLLQGRSLPSTSPIHITAYMSESVVSQPMKQPMVTPEPSPMVKQQSFMAPDAEVMEQAPAQVMVNDTLPVVQQIPVTQESYETVGQYVAEPQQEEMPDPYLQ